MIKFLGCVMKKFIVNLVCCFVPSKKLRHEIRVFSRSTRFKNNIIEIVRENGTRTRVRYIKNCEFIFSGDNNHIVNTLRLWSAEPVSNEFDFSSFNNMQ